MHSTSIPNGINTGHILFQGAKTIERLCGNIHLSAWIEQQWAEEKINKYFMDTNVWPLHDMPLTMPRDENQQLLSKNEATNHEATDAAGDDRVSQREGIQH